MRQADLIKAIATQAGLTERQADEALLALVEHITNALSIEQPVQLAGFGAFVVRRRNARQGTDPQTGNSITISARRQAVFKPSARLKMAIQNHQPR